MLSLIADEKWLVVADVAITLGLAVAAATPTDKDDGVASRVTNIWRTLRRVKAPKQPK